MQTGRTRGRLPLDHSFIIKYNKQRRARARRTYALVAQWIECLTPNEKAAGSIPAGRTIAKPGTSWRPVLLCVMASWRSILSSRSVLSAACLAVCVRFISVLFSRESRDCSLTISVQAGSLRLELKVELGISRRLVWIRKDYI